jgi:ribonuclease HIII
MNNQFTIQKQAKIIAEKLKENLNKLNFSTNELNLKKYNYEFEVSQDKSKAKILVYFGSKGIKTIIQSNINDRLYKELDHILNGKIIFDEAVIEEPKEYIGSDESGKGDFFGPLIVCAFAFDNSIKENLLKLNIKDSKELDNKEIIEIYNELKNKFNDRFEVIEIHPKKYNQLYEKIQNLNKILLWAHSKAINNLLKRFDFNTLIIDKFASKKSFDDKISFTKNLIIEEKAERFTGVAAASIIARAKLVLWFQKKSKELELKIPFGAAVSVTNFAKEIERRKGKDILSELIKLHFKNFKDMNK